MYGGSISVIPLVCSAELINVGISDQARDLGNGAFFIEKHLGFLHSDVGNILERGSCERI